MSGFRNLENDTPQLLETVSVSNISSVAVNKTYDVDLVGTLILAFLYHPSIPTPAGGDYLRFQLLWYDASGVHLLGVDTFEIQSDAHDGSFNGKQTFVRAPVRGSLVNIVSNTGTASSTLTMKVWGARAQARTFEMSQDTTDFTATDGYLAHRTGSGSAGGGPTFYLPAYRGDGILFFSATGTEGTMVQFDVLAGSINTYSYFHYKFLVGGDAVFVPLVYPRRPLRVFAHGPTPSFDVIVKAHAEEIGY